MSKLLTLSDMTVDQLYAAGLIMPLRLTIATHILAASEVLSAGDDRVASQVPIALSLADKLIACHNKTADVGDTVPEK